MGFVEETQITLRPAAPQGEHLKSRRVELAGITPNPEAPWMVQVARNLTDPFDGFRRDASRLMVDRDTRFRPLREYLAAHSS